MDKNTVFHYMNLMGIQAWELRKTDFPEQIITYTLLNNHLPIGYIFLELNSAVNPKSFALVHSICDAFHLTLQSCSENVSHFTIDAINAADIIVIMGMNAKKYFQKTYSIDQESSTNKIMMTVDPMELLKDTNKKRFVWEDLKNMTKLIKSNK